jgi:hypothetical protein
MRQNAIAADLFQTKDCCSCKGLPLPYKDMFALSVAHLAESS